MTALQVINLNKENSPSSTGSSLKSTTPLHDLIRRGEKVCLEALDTLKEYVTSADEMGNTPLHLAVKYNFTYLAKKLLKNGALVNAANTSQITPMHVAAWEGHVTMIQILYDHDADMDPRTDQLDTPLHCSIEHNKDEAAKKLLDLWAKTEVVNDIGLTPLQSADKKYNHKIALEILKKRKFRVAHELWDYAISRTILLAHAFHLEGTRKVQLSGGKYFDLDMEGTKASLIFDCMAEGIQAVSKELPKRYKLTDDLTSLLTRTKTNSALVSHINFREGKPILIRGGPDGHFMTFFVWNNYFAICDRECSSEKSIEYFQIDGESLTSDLFEQMTENHDYASFTKLIGNLKKELRAKPLPEDESDCHLLKQKVENCCWTSTEAGIAAFYRIHALMNSTTSKEENDQEFNEIMLYLQYYIVNKFIKHEELDHTLNHETIKLINSALDNVDYYEDLGKDFKAFLDAKYDTILAKVATLQAQQYPS